MHSGPEPARMNLWAFAQWIDRLGNGVPATAVLNCVRPAKGHKTYKVNVIMV